MTADGTPDDCTGSADPPSNLAREANSIAFLLASAAQLTLADAHPRREGPDDAVTAAMAFRPIVPVQLMIPPPHFV